eukprot:CAMPEP_0184502792 /NCGR_PEP_ID=MMETSP0113_2-20130426/51246_1 /TAXON_ID=91329 /ORGANISM="Norrisiella sphaerica, Strain BC52" /LENGTH=567 /DNA_ID=CAMNT_0026892125 /DNA_START=28 /DNA_END=1731 /DNA_ORIENTATION=+
MDPFFKKCYSCKQSEIKTVYDNVKGNWQECASCGEVIEERQPKLKHTTFSMYRWEPFPACDSNENEASSAGEPSSRTGKVEKDPYDDFETGFCTMQSELYSIDLAFSRSIAGDIIDLQKQIGDYIVSGQNDNIMIGYVTIADLCATFATPLKKSISVRLFLRCMNSSIQEQVTNFEALAVASYAVVVCREFKDMASKIDGGASRTAEEESTEGERPPRGTSKAESLITAAQNSFFIAQTQHSSSSSRPDEPEGNRIEVLWDDIIVESKKKTAKPTVMNEVEIQKHIGMIRNVLNNEPVVVEALRKSMSKYFKDLSLDKDTATLAAHIGNQAVKRHLCYRRNSSSLSAASVYLACQLQGMRTTQSSFCKIVELTEVTLRKVYKELKTHWQDLVPENYKPFRVPNGLKSSFTKKKESEEPTDNLAKILQNPPIPTPPVIKSPLFSPHRPAGAKSSPTTRVESDEYEVVAGLEKFKIPKQFSSDGKDIWAESKGETPRQLLEDYPRPTVVYSDIQGGNRRLRVFEQNSPFPLMRPANTPGTVRNYTKLATSIDTPLVQKFDSFGTETRQN